MKHCATRLCWGFILGLHFSQLNHSGKNLDLAHLSPLVFFCNMEGMLYGLIEARISMLVFVHCIPTVTTGALVVYTIFVDRRAHTVLTLLVFAAIMVYVAVYEDPSSHDRDYNIKR